VQWKTPDDEQSYCPKHVDFHSKNKFEKLVHLVGFIIGIYHDARAHERQTNFIISADIFCTKFNVFNMSYFAKEKALLHIHGNYFGIF
jgi:hypothetical protein